MNKYQKNRKTVDYLKFENKIYENYNHFPIGLILIEKDEKEFNVGIINNYAYDIFELYHDSDFEDLKKQMKKFKKWENNSLQDLNLYNFIFSNNSTKEYCGTFISSLSMIYVKIKYYNNCIFISIDNYNDERKDLQGSLVKSLKYQYLVTLYHELNNPLNALMNISDDYNFESNNEGKKDFDDIKLKLKQINLLVILIKIFIKNFIWYFRVIFELTNNIETNSISKINLEYLFTKNINKYKNLFKYKEIGYEKDYIYLRDKFILSDSKHMNNFFSGIFVYLYHILPKKNGFTIKHSILKEENLKINFLKIVKNPNHKGRRSLILEDIDLNKKAFDFSQSVQTIEITKELLFRLASMLNIRIKFYSENEDLIISIILPFSFEKEGIEEKDDIREFSPRQKLLALNGINRTVPIYNIWQTSFTDNPNDIDNISSSPIQTCLTTQNNLTNHTNYNYNITITGPNDNYTNIINQESIFSSSNVINDKKKHQNQNYNKITTEQNELYKLENDPFIRMTKEKNPFIRELNNEKRDDSFNSYSKKSNSDSEEENKEVYVEEENNCFLNYSNQSKNIYTYNAENYQNNMDLNLNKSEIITKKSITYQKQNEMKLNSQITGKKKNNYETNIENKKKKYETNIIDPNRIKTKMKDKSKTDNLNINKSNNLNINNNIKNNKNNNNCKRCNDVLLCDDEEFNLSTIKNMLKKFKVNADISTNGKECLDSILKKKELNCNCNKSSYKLLLLDMMMPVMDGFEAAKKIQELINKKEINDCLKIVIVSAHIESNLVKSLKELKCVVEEVAKPLKKTKLEEILNNYYFCN